MKRQEYKEWLEKELVGKSQKYKFDLISRAGRVERAFAEIEPGFTLDSEYKKDGGESVKGLLRCWGRDLKGTGIKLPLNTNQMDAITLAANWYFKFLKETETK